MGKKESGRGRSMVLPYRSEQFRVVSIDNKSRSNTTLLTEIFPPILRQILIVKNPENSSNNYRDSLEKLGLSVFEASSVDSGIIAAQAKSFDLIIISLFLKGRCGFSMARVLREMEAYKNTPLIATAPIDLTKERTNLLKDFDSFLTEPIRVKKLIPIFKKSLTSSD